MRWIFATLLMCQVAEGAVITAATGSRADVGTAYAACSNGDTLQIPAGSNAWSTTLTVTKAITVQGAGTNGSGGTVISFGADTPLFTFNTESNIAANMRLADIQFAAGAAPSSSAWFYITGCNTNNSYMVVSNCLFNGTTSPCPFVIGAIGVMTRCYWKITSNIGCYIYHENWNGKLYSAGSFADPVIYGNDKWWVIESSIVEGSSSVYAFTDAYRGARYVVRYCNLTNRWLEMHGTESGFVRGTRAVESYHNTFYNDGVTDYGHNGRSATLIVWSNTINNAGSAGNFAHLDAYRKTVVASPWGGATGDNPVDVNDTNIFASGTASAGGTKFLTDNTKSWTPNQWAGYTLARMTPLATNGTLLTDFRHGYIMSNTTTTAYVDRNIGGAFPDIVYAAGDTYRIYKVLQVLDQPGAGQDTTEMFWRKNSALTLSGNTATATLSSHGFTTGDTIIIAEIFLNPDFIYTEAQVTVLNANSYTFPLYHANGTAGANFEGQTTKVGNPFPQTIDPCYEWGNLNGATPIHFSSGATNIVRSGEHYFNSTPKPGYTPLAFPHPLLGATGGGGSGVTQGTNAMASGNMVISGKGGP